MRASKPQYNSWIRVRKLIIFAVIDLLLSIGIVLADNLLIQISFLFGLIVVSYILLIVGLSYYYFTIKGFQTKIHQLLVDQTPSCDLNNYNILDIGAGSGSLSILLENKFKTAKVYAIDYWGNDWEYSKALCERNAKITGAEIEFIKASASNLPFPTHNFRLITSCLTFHEVKDCDDIYKVIDEAQRVLDDDGYFIYLDLFLDNKTYPDLETNLQTTLGTDYQLIKLDHLIDLPLILKHNKVLGNAAIIIGQKRKESF